jgi:hypothetical protein
MPQKGDHAANARMFLRSSAAAAGIRSRFRQQSPVLDVIMKINSEFVSAHLTARFQASERSDRKQSRFSLSARCRTWRALERCCAAHGLLSKLLLLARRVESRGRAPRQQRGDQVRGCPRAGAFRSAVAISIPRGVVTELIPAGLRPAEPAHFELTDMKVLQTCYAWELSA